MSEVKLQYIKQRLVASKGIWPQISYESGVGLRTLSYIISGDHAQRITTINKLYKYLKKLEAKNDN